MNNSKGFIVSFLLCQIHSNSDLCSTNAQNGVCQIYEPISKKAFSMNATFNVILGLFKNLLFKNLDLSGSKKKFQNFYSCWPLLFHNVIIHHHQSYPQSTYDYLSRVHCIFKDSHPAFESGHLKQG